MIISPKKDLGKSVWNINSIELTKESSVKLLDIENYNKLKFEKRVSNIWKQASNSLNAICRPQT